MNFSNVTTAAIALIFAAPLCAQEADAPKFETGPVFADFGPHAPVEGLKPFPDDVQFAIAFDVAAKADDGARNRGFESAARFMNMHAAAGVPESSIDLVVVVHGKAVLDLLSDGAWDARQPADRDGPLQNPSAAMVQAMLDKGVRFVVCGQSAAANGVTKEQLIPDVQIELSAMTAHALLQQQGYTVNPF